MPELARLHFPEFVKLTEFSVTPLPSAELSAPSQASLQCLTTWKECDEY